MGDDTEEAAIFAATDTSIGEKVRDFGYLSTFQDASDVIDNATHYLLYGAVESPGYRATLLSKLAIKDSLGPVI